jgi:hypothetical protein
MRSALLPLILNSDPMIPSVRLAFLPILETVERKVNKWIKETLAWMPRDIPRPKGVPEKADPYDDLFWLTYFTINDLARQAVNALKQDVR